MEQKHTPLPWYIEGSPTKVRADFGAARFRVTVADCAVDPTLIPQDHANAAFIVRAVNAHDALLGACKAALTHPLLDGVLPDDMVHLLRAAITAGEGKG